MVFPRWAAVLPVLVLATTACSVPAAETNTAWSSLETFRAAQRRELYRGCVRMFHEREVRGARVAGVNPQLACIEFAKRKVDPDE